MEGREMVIEDGVEEDEAETEEHCEERRFKVGELVEFWEGALVRGNRTDSGDPAWVKADYGEGEYGVKMVTNTRGKLRRMPWKSLFKDGSFNKFKLSAKGGRVRTSERMREIEQDKAEAKLGGELRETQRELRKAHKDKKDTEQQAEARLRLHEMEARQAEKNLTATHKRQLEEMEGDLNRRRERVLEERDESYRKSRLKRREVTRNLEKTHTELSTVMSEKEELAKAVKRGIVTLHTAREEGLGWQGKYTDQQDKNKEREKLLTFLGRALVEKTRQFAVLNKQCESLGNKVKEGEQEISTHAELTREVSNLVYSSLFLSSDFLISLLLHLEREELGKKKETAKRRRRGKPCVFSWRRQGRMLPDTRPRKR